MKDIQRPILAVVAALLALATLALCPAPAGTNEDLGILPVDQKLFGKSYGEWGAEWWKWAISIPAEENPVLDPTGEFGHVGQTGPVWFLAGTFGGGAVERWLTVPKDKWLFYPILNAVWWAPEDLATAAFVAETFFGLDPDTLTDEELITLVAVFSLERLVRIGCTIDGVRVEDVRQYRATSRGFMIADTDLLDDFGLAISTPNVAVSHGYWIMLAPLPPGQHTIHFEGRFHSELFGKGTLEVTYHLTVE